MADDRPDRQQVKTPPPVAGVQGPSPGSEDSATSEFPSPGTGDPRTSNSTAASSRAWDADAATMVEGGAAVVPARMPIFASQIMLGPGMVLSQRYRIAQILGEGGMGAVYKAQDSELDRLVALKVIRPELAGNAGILQRFKQEILLASKVTDRHVIRIYDLGESDGIRFITMEYVDGEDLRSILRSQGRLAVEEAVSIIEQVLRGLDAAHSQGIIHRDLKPGNIMRATDGRVVVMDFGLARTLGGDGMTGTGLMIGTMEYMSPEQAQAKDLDARSDIFTVGLILYELLTGKMPYEAESAIASLLKRTQQRAVPISDINNEVPARLSNIVSKCLERDPAARYQTVREVLADLEAWRGNGRVSASSSFGRRLQDVPWKWVAGGIAALALAAGLWTFRSSTGKTQTTASRAAAVSMAILPFHNASGDPGLDWLGPSLAEMLSTDVGQSASLRTVSPDRLHQLIKDLHISTDSRDPIILKQLAEFSNAQTVVWGDYVKVGEQIRISATVQDFKHQRVSTLTSEATSDKALLSAVDALAESIRSNLALAPEIVQELKAQAFRPSTKSVEALRAYNEGLELTRQGNSLGAQKKFENATQADPDFALAYSRLAQTYSLLGYDNEAERNSRRALELSQQLPPAEKYLIEASNARVLNDNQKAIASYENLAKVSPDDPDIQFTLAGLYENAGDYEKALAHLGKVLEQDPKYVDALLASGRVHIRSGNPQNGLDYLNRAFSLAVQLDNQQEKASILQATGVAYRLMGKPEDAIRNYQESLAIKRQIGDKRGIAVSLNERAQAEVMLGRPDAAFASYKEALQIRREIGDKRGVSDTLNDLGNFDLERSKPDEALQRYKESLQIQRDLGDEANQGMILNNIGSAYLAKGQYEDALTYYQQALQLREKLKVDGEIAETTRNIAVTNTKLGRYDDALSQYVKALDLWRASGDRRGSAMNSYDMGGVFAYQGKYGAALNSRQEAVKTFRDLKDRTSWMAQSLMGYAEALAQNGRGDEAQSSLDEASSLARELKNERLAIQVLRTAGEVAWFRGDLRSARTSYEQALQSATRAKDSEAALLAELEIARLDIAEGRPATGALKNLAQKLETQGLKYEAVESSIYLAQALNNNKQLAPARVEAERALNRAEKLGLQSLQAECEYILATNLRLGGNAALAAAHYHRALTLLEAIHKESGSDKIMARRDLGAIEADARHWTASGS